MSKNNNRLLKSGLTILTSTFKEALIVSVDLYKILIPCLIITKILEISGVITHIGKFLNPLMGLVGLPGILGFAWATSMLAGLYGGLIVLVNLSSSVSLTIAQTTTIIAMILIAHSFPAELTIVKRAGMRAYFAILLRMGSALLYAKILAWVYQFFEGVQRINTNFEFFQDSSTSLIDWSVNQIKFLLIIFVVLFGLTLFMKAIDHFGITSMINYLLKPLMNFIGIGKDAIPITVIGVVMGLTYGGGIINLEAKSGRIKQRDVFFSLALMCIFHSIIEDTLTALLFGAEIFGVLWGRLVFTFVIMFLMKQIFKRMTDQDFEKFLYKHKPAREGA